jgi:hypothetical protein
MANWYRRRRRAPRERARFREEGMTIGELIASLFRAPAAARCLFVQNRSSQRRRLG